MAVLENAPQLGVVFEETWNSTYQT